MILTLKRLHVGHFVNVTQKTVLLGPGSEAGHSVVKFPRPRPGTCKVVVRFGGDAVYAGSAISERVAC